MNKLILLLYVAIYLCAGILLLNISLHVQVSENTWEVLRISHSQIKNIPGGSFFGGDDQLLYRKSEIMRTTDQYLGQISAILHQEEIVAENIHSILALRDSIIIALSYHDREVDATNVFNLLDNLKSHEALDQRVKAHHTDYIRHQLPYIRHQIIELLRERRGIYEIEHSYVPARTLVIPDRLTLSRDQPVGVTLALSVSPFYEGQIQVNGQSFPVKNGVAQVSLPRRGYTDQYPLTMEVAFADTVLRTTRTIYIETAACHDTTGLSK
jgi:hypothetical protein